MGITLTIPGADFSANGIAPIRDDVLAYRNLLIAAGNTFSNSKLAALNTFIKTLDSAGVLSKLDQIYTFNGSALSGSLKKFKGGADLAVVGSPDPLFSNLGLTLSGVEGVLTTGYTAPGLGAISWYCGTNTIESLVLAISGNVTHEMSVNFSGQIQAAFGNGGGINVVTYTDINKVGLWTISRDSTTSLKLYKNASEVVNETTSTSIVASSSVTQIGARPGLSLGGSHLTRFCAFWNTSATPGDVNVLSTALNSYLLVT
jgi:hypothetical protein